MVLPILLAVSSTMTEINPSDVEFPITESTSRIEILEDAVNMDGICVATSFTDYVCY
tara:strand:+ start:55 stop:225 length:171 start_codon:yes stop_codon:yes gene_type:complete